MVHTASKQPSAVPVGGSTDRMNLNDPSMFIQPCVSVRKVGTIWAMVVSLRNSTGPTTSWATAMNSICHQRRSAGTVPASATRDPMMVAGMAASAQDAADP